MCVFSPPPETEPDHTLNVWLSLAVVICIVAAVIAWRTWNNPSLDAVRLRQISAAWMAGLADKRPADADTETPKQEEIRK